MIHIITRGVANTGYGTMYHVMKNSSDDSGGLPHHLVAIIFDIDVEYHGLEINQDGEIIMSVFADEYDGFFLYHKKTDGTWQRYLIQDQVTTDYVLVYSATDSMGNSWFLAMYTVQLLGFLEHSLIAIEMER